MSEDSKQLGVAPTHDGAASKQPSKPSAAEQPREHDAVINEEDGGVAESPATLGSTSKIKKSKRKKLKNALTGGTSTADEASSSSSKPKTEPTLSQGKLQQVLQNNPALEKELSGMSPDKMEEMMKKLSMSDLLTGLAVGGKNQKDMASYKFWQTQPVPRLGEKSEIKEGPIKRIDLERVPKEPSALISGFEWVTMDLMDATEIEEVYKLLTHHYVEDNEALFRFNYSEAFLNWALKSPGWRKEWHVGVRASKSRKLVAFISAIPLQLRVRQKTLNASEVNFLCIHKKLREKRLTPVLIQEITRRCYLVGVYQAIYTAGIVLPTPISSCRYYHRSINWAKLHEVGFSPLPAGSTKQRQIFRYQLPDKTSTEGLRRMERKDLDAVTDLLKRYLANFDAAPVFNKEEVEHWLLHEDKEGVEEVVWTYVVEDVESHQITDFFSFYNLESTVIGHQKHDNIRAAYLFYYASETAFIEKDQPHALKTRLNALVEDALIVAKQGQFNFDVCNALTLLDNSLFLDKQKFGAGDGRLNYYLYNYSTAPIHGGLNSSDEPDESNGSGVGVVML